MEAPDICARSEGCAAFTLVIVSNVRRTSLAVGGAISESSIDAFLFQLDLTRTGSSLGGFWGRFWSSIRHSDSIRTQSHSGSGESERRVVFGVITSRSFMRLVKGSLASRSALQCEVIFSKRRLTLWQGQEAVDASPSFRRFAKSRIAKTSELPVFSGVVSLRESLIKSFLGAAFPWLRAFCSFEFCMRSVEKLLFWRLSVFRSSSTRGFPDIAHATMRLASE